jgi:hypothetical protein
MGSEAIIAVKREPGIDQIISNEDWNTPETLNKVGATVSSQIAPVSWFYKETPQPRQNLNHSKDRQALETPPLLQGNSSHLTPKTPNFEEYIESPSIKRIRKTQQGTNFSQFTKG